MAWSGVKVTAGHRHTAFQRRQDSCPCPPLAVSYSVGQNIPSAMLRLMLRSVVLGLYDGRPCVREKVLEWVKVKGVAPQNHHGGIVDSVVEPTCPRLPTVLGQVSRRSTAGIARHRDRQGQVRRWGQGLKPPAYPGSREATSTSLFPENVPDGGKVSVDRLAQVEAAFRILSGKLTLAELKALAAVLSDPDLSSLLAGVIDEAVIGPHLRFNGL